MEPSQGLIDARESGGFAQVVQGIRLRRHHFVEKLFVKLESPPWLTQFHLVVSLCPERDKNLAVKRSPLGGIVLRVLQNRQGGINPFFRFTGPVKIAERIGGVRQHHRQIASRHQPIPDLFEPADRQVEHRESSLRIPVPQDIAKRVAGVADAGSTRESMGSLRAAASEMSKAFWRASIASAGRSRLAAPSSPRMRPSLRKTP